MSSDFKNMTLPLYGTEKSRINSVAIGDRNDVVSTGCPTCQNHQVSSVLGNRRPGAASNDVSLLTAIDGAVGHKMRIWSAQKKELEAKLEAKTKELQTVTTERQIREEALKKEMEDSKRKLEDRLHELDEQVKTFRSQCENKIREEQQRSSRLHQDLTRQLNQREQELSRAKDRLAESGRTIGVLETERVKLAGELREIRLQKESLLNRTKDLQHDLEALQTSAQNRMGTVREIEERYQQKISEAEKRSNEQERLLSEHVARIDGLQKALMLARQVQKQTVDDKRKLDEELAKKEYDVKRLSAELDGTKLALGRLTTEHSSCACRIADLHKTVNTLKLSNAAIPPGNAADKNEQKQQIAELRRQVTQLGAKLESSRAERNNLEVRIAESDMVVRKWRETTESLTSEIARLSKDHEREVNDLKMQLSNLESMLKKSATHEASLRNQLHENFRSDGEIERKLEAARKESERLHVELTESRQQIDSLSQERSSLFDQLAENGRLRFELEQTQRRLEETMEEAKQFKKLAAELRSRKKAEEMVPVGRNSPTLTVSPSLTATSSGKMMTNFQTQAISRLSSDSPTFVLPTSTSVSQQHHLETASVGQTTMTSPAFRQIPSVPPETIPSNNCNNNNRRFVISTDPQTSCSSPNDEFSKMMRDSEIEKSSKEIISNSIISEWERYSCAEARSLEAALSCQLEALTAASEKILSQICIVGKKE